MRLLFLGDVVGRIGREAVALRLPQLCAHLQPDFIVVNGENAAGGYGLNKKIAKELKDAGADVITTGNHVWDQREFMQEITGLDYVLRPANLPAVQPGRGFGIFTAKNGKRVSVVHLLGQLGMQPAENPFVAANTIFETYQLGTQANACLVDFHAEMTSEKMAMAHHCDGRASLVVGTHTHIPTADAQILPGGTAAQSDAGMCGDYDSVIGMNKTEAVFRMSTNLPTLNKMKPAEGEATVCGTFVITDDATGLALEIHPIRIGGRLQQSLPAA